METLTFSRVIFLLFIVILSVYFFYLNKNFKEHFTSELPSDTVDRIVKETYLKQYKREPTEKELVFFQAVNLEKQPSEQELINMIINSSELIDKVNDYKSPIVYQEALGTEDDVTEVFNTILNRLPSEDELAYFSKMLKTDPTFTMDKFKQILYGSEEFNRLEKTQSNQVYSNLIGGITDRQITYMLMTIYKEIVGTENIDTDEMRFLKKKFIEFSLDETIFRQFLTNYIKNQPFSVQVAAAQKAKQFIEEEKRPSIQTMDEMKKELYTQVMNDIKQQSIIQQESIGYMQPNLSQKTVEYATTNQKQDSGETIQEVVEMEQPNKQVIEVLLKTIPEKSNYLDSSDVMDQIKKQAQCVFDKNAIDKKYQENQQKSMAALIDQRNSEQLKDTCVRNKTYLGIDEDMVLNPELRWTVPQRYPPVCVGGENKYVPTIDQTALIGTLLEDAQDTKVGSVLPFYPPR